MKTAYSKPLETLVLEPAEDIALADILVNLVNFAGFQGQIGTAGIVFRLIHVVNTHRSVGRRHRWHYYFTNFSYVRALLVFS